MAASIYDWSSTPDNNANADTDLTWALGQPPSTVNKSARMMMKRVKDLLVDIGGSLTASGTANALTVTANSGFSTYVNGRILAFRAASDNTGAATLNVNLIGAKAIRKMTPTGEADILAKEIKAGGIYIAQYQAALNGGAGAWLLLNTTGDPVTHAVPIGSMVDFAGTSVPNGWLLCYGQAVSRTTYADLFAVIGTTFGAGNGSTTFNVPDFRGRVGAGKDDMGGTDSGLLSSVFGAAAKTLGGVLGAASHLLTTAQIPSHNHGGSTNSTGAHSHTIDPGWRTHGSGGQGSITGWSDGDITISGTYNKTTNSTGSHSHTISSEGGDQAHPNAQPTLIVNKIIKASHQW